MEQLLKNFIDSASIFQKGLFLMIAGICFVFAVQVIFILVVKLWPKPKQTEH